jgi:hypothetical protein
VAGSYEYGDERFCFDAKEFSNNLHIIMICDSNLKSRPVDHSNTCVEHIVRFYGN